jgi:hypothetical protein
VALKYTGRVAQAQDLSKGFSGQIPSPVIMRYTVEGRIPADIFIRSCGLKTRVGSVIASVSIDGTPVPGLRDIAGSSSSQMVIFEATPHFFAKAGQVLSFDVSASVGAQDLDISIHYGEGYCPSH